MAKFLPADERSDAPSSERTVRRALADLPDDWTVFCSVRWQAIRGGRQGDGEADFLVLHPDHGVLVLEVKGGRLEVESGQWFSTDRNDVRHPIKNPFEQATASKYALIGYMREFQPQLGHTPVGHAVVFPDASDLPAIGLNPRAIVIDGEDLARPKAAIDRVLNHWQHLGKCKATKDDIKRLVNRLAPTLKIERRLRGAVAAAERELVALTAQQVATLALLRRNRRCVIRGGAGTGKTFLAVEKARQLAADGARVLLTCYNAPLAKWIATQDLGSVLVSTFHSLCRKQAKELGMTIPAEPPEEWWDEQAPSVLGTWATSFKERFDAVIIDEAQDFSDDWLRSIFLQLSSPDESPVYVFTDSHQQLYRRGELSTDTWASAELDINCRNTLQIAKCVAAVFRDDPPKQGAEGRAPIFTEASSGNAPSVAQDVVDQLIGREGFSPTQIAVISDSRAIVDGLRQLVAGGHSFVALEEKGIAAETVHRFKGLEAEVVVLVLSEHVLAQGAVTSPVLYVGASRGRSLLYVIGPQSARSRLGLS